MESNTKKNREEVMQSHEGLRDVAVSTDSRCNARKENEGMKKIFAVTLVAALAMFAGSAYANFCARDVVPASTLLVPYAAVSMIGNTPDPSGATTILSVTNTSHEATIIHIVIWNAVSKGIVDFDEVLSGYDVWLINFRDLLSGNWSAFDTSRSPTAFPNIETSLLKRTPFEWGPDGRSAYGAVPAPFTTPWSRALPVPQPTNATPATLCSMPFTNAVGAAYAPLIVAGLQDPIFSRSHLGCGTQVANRKPGDWLSTLTNNPLFFYVTVDNVKVCNLNFPDDPGYFGAQGIYNYENVLIGEIYWLDASKNYSEATPAVHIESDLASRLGLTGGTTEFYLGSNLIRSAPTYLEPLATAFGFKYYNGGGVTSSVLVWKNYWEFSRPLDNPLGNVNDCGAYLYYAWDDDEHVITRGVTCPISPCQGADIDPNEFPFETQMVPITTTNFDLPGTSGWMLLVFPPSYDQYFWQTNGDPTPNLTLLNRLYQAWVGTRIEYGTYSMGLEAATMANAHCFPDQRLPWLGINYPHWGGYDLDWYLYAGATK